MKKFSIPSGTRDLIRMECKNKRALQQAVEAVFERYDYEEIMTPSIEYYQTYQTGFEQLKDESMYKFFDHEGKILTLRMDMTVPIARVCATKLKDQQLPLRLRYTSNVYKVKQSFAGKRNEVTDCGVELIGLSDKESDLEILCCALDVMKALRQKDYTLEIGNVNFFHSACKNLKLTEEEMERLADFIDRKSMIELEAYLQQLHLQEKVQQFFLQLPLLCGDETVLDQAKAYCFHPEQLAIIYQLECLLKELRTLGYQDHITIDLGKVPHLNYYSGLLLEGYVGGIGTSVLSGGRYDHLLTKFGVSLPAIGFSLKLDYLTALFPAPKPENKLIRLRYPLNEQLVAFEQAAVLRKRHRVRLEPAAIDQIEIEEVEE